VWQSTGLTLWRASHYLCEYQLEHHQKLFQENKRTLELGAGLGLNGILSWKLMTRKNDSSQVCITDGDSDALVQLRENVNRNRSSPSVDDYDSSKVSCHQLIWGKESATQFLTQIAKNQKYDIIIASDIIYSLVIVEPLWQTVEQLLKKEGGIFIMAYARREVPVSIELVLNASMEHGFSYELVKENTTDGIWVYEFRHETAKK
jgi:predicted nicotinamide N-methyase